MSKSKYRLLGFTLHEEKIWAVLQNGPKNVSSLAVLTKFPRTTLYTAITSLKKRGLTTIHKKGKSTIISPIAKPTIKSLIGKCESDLNFHQNSNRETDLVESVTNQNDSGFRTIHGELAMFKVWQALADTNAKRFYSIQSTKSLINLIKRFTSEDFIPINNIIKKRRIVADVVLREDNLPTYLSYYKDKPDIQKSTIESFIGRMADATLVKNDYLNSNAELIMMGNSAFLMNWKDEIGIEIKNRDMTDFLKELFELAKGYGKKVDYTEYMRDNLKKILGKQLKREY